MARWILSLLLLAAVGGVVSCDRTVDRSKAVERHKMLASELRDNHLYAAAVDEYRKILDYDEIDDAVRGNINYLIGRLYYEQVQDYEQAAAYYVRARALDPGADYNAEASKNLVAALEKSGNIVNARRQLDRLTNLDAGPANDSDVTVARIGETPIWWSQVEDAIATLPPDAQQQFSSREARVAFLHQYVGTELLYHAALREDYASDPEVKKQQQLFHRQVLTERYVLDHVIPKINIDTADVRNFYSANRSARYNDAPYDSVRAQVFLDYQSQKTQSAFQDYISMLAQNERVEFYDQNVK